MFNHMLKGDSSTCPMNEQEWCAEYEDDIDSIFVNLQNNKESYTGYNGSQVWATIYHENCLSDQILRGKYSKGDVISADTCSEETLLYQLVSGLHASVNMHIATNYHDMKLNRTFANHKVYMNSLGSHPDRIKNLYFIYSAVMRAVSRAKSTLEAYNYDTKLDKE